MIKKVRSEGVSQNIMPGESLIISVLTDPDMWENVAVLDPGVEYTLCAVYVNGHKETHSDYYTVVLGDQQARLN